MSDVQGELLTLMKKFASKEKSLTDTLQDSMDKINETVEHCSQVKDHYGNSLMAIGNDDKVETFTNYGFSNDTLNFPLWLALYNDSWVFKRAIDKPAQDEIRCGVTLQGNSDFSKVYTYINQARFDMIQLLQWGALFGGSVAVMMFDNIKDEEYAHPMNKNKIKQSKVIRYYVTDRWYGVTPSSETVTNMKDIDFGKPKYYDITFADGKSCKVGVMLKVVILLMNYQEMIN